MTVNMKKVYQHKFEILKIVNFFHITRALLSVSELTEQAYSNPHLVNFIAASQLSWKTQTFNLHVTFLIFPAKTYARAWVLLSETEEYSA